MRRHDAEAVLAARAKLAQRFDAVRTGGKGTARRGLAQLELRRAAEGETAEREDRPRDRQGVSEKGADGSPEKAG